MEVLGLQPENTAEKLLYDYFSTLNIEGISWFNLDLPQINEIDCIGWFKEYGFFLIETKGFKIEDFNSLTLDKITFNNKAHQKKYGHKPSPWKQAQNAARLLATFLSNLYYTRNIFPSKISKNACIPFVFSATYFPFISESEFKVTFPQVYEILSDYIIFNDCHLNIEYFKKKLLNIGIQQAKKRSSDSHKKSIRIYNTDLVTLYKEKVFIQVAELSHNEKYDKNLLHLLESADLKEELADINFDFPILRYGYAGTGKTIIAIKILEKFAMKNKQVLFTCFNKVLATDLSRFNKLSNEVAYKYFENITIKDIHELLFEYSPFTKFIDFETSSDKIDDFFDTIVNEIIQAGFFKGIFEYIVIDEAQDLKDYGWELIIHLAKRGFNSLIVLNGKEQNLYLQKPSKYLSRFEDVCKRIQEEKGLKGNYRQKRRVYRNKTRTFLFSQSFLEHYPESRKSIKFIQENEAKKDPTFEFTRQIGNFPFILEKVNAKSSFRKALTKGIKHCLAENENYGLGASGILIIVPFKFDAKFPAKNNYRNLAIRILKDLKLDYIDYTKDENRRLDYLINQVRIVSFHSCRGIEANFSLILGFEEIFRLSEATQCDYHKLGYIVLSRAKYETYVFIDSSRKEDKISKFLNFTKEVYASVAPEERFIYDIKAESSK